MGQGVVSRGYRHGPPLSMSGGSERVRWELRRQNKEEFLLCHRSIPHPDHILQHLLGIPSPYTGGSSTDVHPSNLK